MFKPTNSPFRRPFVAAAFLTGIFSTGAGASIVAQYTFTTGSVTGANSATATAANVAAAAPGATPSVFGVTNGGNSTATISTATSTAYIRADLTPTVANIYTSTRYFTFSVDLTSAYNLQSLTFEYGGNPAGATPINYGFAAQIQVGAGAWTNLGVSEGTAVTGTGSYVKIGDYLATLTGAGYQNLNNTTVSFRFFIADDATGNGTNGRLTNVILNAEAVPEPSSILLGGFGALALLRRRRK